MRYLVLVAYEGSTWETATEAERQAYFEAHHAFERAVRERGSLVAGEALATPDTATTLRHDGDGVVLADGPYAETAEQVGGFYLVEMPDLDAMTAAAALLPGPYAVEVRPVVEVEGFERAV